MKTAPLLALTALVALCGCAASDDSCITTPLFNGGSSGPPSFRVGVPASLEVSAVQTLSCNDSAASQVPDSVSAEVFDPDNHLPPLRGESHGERSVRLRPFHSQDDRAPPHVLVAFAPVGSVQQRGVYVAKDWSGRPTATTLPLPRCTQLDRTTRGTWVCDGVALHEGGRTQRLGTSPRWRRTWRWSGMSSGWWAARAACAASWTRAPTWS